jgi:hypothetical protein
VDILTGERTFHRRDSVLSKLGFYRMEAALPRGRKVLEIKLLRFLPSVDCRNQEMSGPSLQGYLVT